MAITAELNVENQDVLGSLREFFKSILELEDIGAILVPQQLPMKKMIMQSFEHRGFSVVEVISNCHVNLGRRNKMKNPIHMNRWIAGKTVTQSKYKELPPEERKGLYPVGVFAEDKERLEYTDLYYEHIVPTAAGPAGGGAAPKGRGGKQ